MEDTRLKEKEADGKRRQGKKEKQRDESEQGGEKEGD